MSHCAKRTGKDRGCREQGTTLLELLVAVALFVILSSAVFLLLNNAQQRFVTETQMVDSFQTARLGMDQMTRDIHTAGFPAQNTMWASVLAANSTAYAVAPFAWDPGYPAVPGCAVTACTVPNNFDLIVEGNISPSTGNAVQWIRYQLTGTTLFRGVVTKTAGKPNAATSAPGVLLPYIDNVINNSSAEDIANYQKYYPNLFPGGAPVPIFTYVCDNSTGPPVPCNAAAAPNNTVSYVREVNITLIVKAVNADERTGQPRIVTLTARAERINPRD